MYNGKIVKYGVRQLLDHEINYLTHDLKLTTVFVPRIWYYYVQGEKLWICTDHKPEYLFSQKEANMRIHNGIELLRDFDYENCTTQERLML